MAKLSFKDQPNGKCLECKWNNSHSEMMNCGCPDTHVTNMVCIQKRQMTHLSNIAFYESQSSDEGEDWKNDGT
jgi:hypothetical protein